YFPTKNYSDLLLSAVTITKRKWPVKYGLRVGASRTAVTQSLGDPNEKTHSTAKYCGVSSCVIFSFHNGYISKLTWDLFLVYPIAENQIVLRGYRFEHRLEDIQTLNERAFRGELHISAISIHAYAYVTGRYALLPCGATMGDGYGPILVRKIPKPNAQIPNPH